MVTILMISAKMATLGHLKVKIFLNNGYDIIFFVLDATSKNLSRVSYYNVNVVMRLKFGNSSISMREVIIT